MPKFGSKIPSRYFRATIFRKLLIYLKSAPSDLSNCKLSQKKTKIAKFRTKNTLFGYGLKKLLSCLKSAPSNLSKCKISPNKQKSKNA